MTHEIDQSIVESLQENIIAPEEIEEVEQADEKEEEESEQEE